MEDEIYETLIADSFIASEAEGRIKFYQYPATGDVTAPYIVIDPLMPGKASDYASNKPLTDEYFYQIDVWSLGRDRTKQLAKRIRTVLKTIGMEESKSGVQEWDADTGIFRIARRYSAKRYNENMRRITNG